MNEREQILYKHSTYVMPTYAPTLALVKGKGAWVWDVEDNRYLDFLSGIAVTNVGHCHPRHVKAIRKQAGTLMHVSNLFYNREQPELAHRLSDISLRGKCFFCNSGAEANEALIKLARLWGKPRGRHEIVTMANSFHGRTMATISATGQSKVQDGFAPLLEGFVQATFNDLDSVRAALSPRTAAVLVEAIQGEGGVRPATRAFMEGLRRLCDEQGILMLCDEVQCGMGRTGRWFGYEHFGIQPDAISLAKGLGGGFPIGAIVVRPSLSDVFQPGRHATTFGGTPLACAAARAVIDIIEDEGLRANAQLRGQQFMDRLKQLATRYAWIREVRGMGLMIGMELDRPAAGLQELLLEKGLLALATAHTVIRFLPPLNLRRSQVTKAVRMVDKACAAFNATSQGEKTA